MTRINRGFNGKKGRFNIKREQPPSSPRIFNPIDPTKIDNTVLTSTNLHLRDARCHPQDVKSRRNSNKNYEICENIHTKLEYKNDETNDKRP